MNTIQKTAKVAGGLYLLMIPFAVLGILYVPANIYVAGDAAATVANILENERLFRLSIISALVVQVIQVGLVLALYKLLHSVNKTYAVLMVAFIIPAVAIAMLNELNMLAALEFATAASYLGSFAEAQRQAFALFFLELHEYGVLIAQVFWGLWLFPMGYLVYKSGYIPWFIGVLLMIGCFGYLFDSFVLLLDVDTPVLLSQYLFIGEIALPLWLLFKGVDEIAYEAQLPAISS